MDRHKLPFRLNCEGYFIKDGKVLAKDSGKGFLMFPGGGVDEGEDVQKAMIRETFEETGAIVENVNALGDIKFIWGADWAKTVKQKKRYEQFQGDEMFFFSGVIKEFDESEGIEEAEEDAWNGEKLMTITEAIEFIENSRPFDEDVKEYREAQLKFLNDLLKNRKG